jgi:hypothetical protein
VWRTLHDILDEMYMRFNVLLPVIMVITVFCDVIQCNAFYMFQRFEGAYFLHFQSI